MKSVSPDTHDILEIPYSRVKLVLLTLVLLSFACVLGFWTVVLFASGSPILYLIGCGLALFLVGLLAMAPPLIRAWLHEGPVVTMDADGIRDTRQSVDFIAWTDVADIELGLGAASYRLCFTFRDAVREQGRLSPVSRVFRLLMSTGDWNVDLRLLAGSRLRIWQAAKQMRQLGIRQHVLRSRESLRRTGPEAAAGEHRLEY